MARQRSTVAKRQRELNLAERRQEKAARRAALKERSQSPTTDDGLDPDIAHIVPGPQPALPADVQD